MEIFKKDSQVIKTLEIAVFFMFLIFLFYFVSSFMSAIEIFVSELQSNAIAGLEIK